jgi:WD40-like Beta Propeller Repeat
MNKLSLDKPVATPLACAALMALAACGGGGDDGINGPTAEALDAERVQALAAGTPTVGAVMLATSNAAGAARGGNLCAISADGSKVLFSSASSSIVAGDTNNASDVFQKNLRTGAVTRVSTSSAGAQVAGGASCIGMTPDARSVLLGVGNDTFVKNLATGALTNVSPPAGSVAQVQGFSAAAISDDGNQVAFTTIPTQSYVGPYLYVNNVPARIVIRNLASGSLSTLPTDNGSVANGEVVYGGVSFSPNGSKLAFVSTSSSLVPGDTNAQPDVFVRDLLSGATQLVSSDSNGTPATATVCCNSSYYNVRFVSDTRVQFLAAQPSSLGERADYLKNLGSGALTVLLASTEGDDPSLSGDGTQLAFSRIYTGFSRRSFVRDLGTGQERLASASAAGVPSNGSTSRPLISRDGSSVAFTADSSNLVSPRPPAGSFQVYVKTLAAPATTAQ